MTTTLPLAAGWLRQALALLHSTMAVPLWLLLAAAAVLAAAMILLHRRHQHALAVKAWLMREAVRNEDYAFRLSPQGLPPGERAMLDTLNDLGLEIGRLMDKREVESWQRMARVLTHEIMNATAPISSITQAWLASPRVHGTEYEEGLRAIQQTASGLTAFVESYRKMTQLQEPVLGEVDLHEVASHLQALHPGLEWEVRLDDAPTVLADSQLLHQALTNIVKNAAEAGARRIGLNWNGTLLVSNDGLPIPSDARREVFVPFFTTKRTGSGIGLPFSRQIIMAQGGNLSLLPVPVSGYHTTFALSLAPAVR